MEETKVKKIHIEIIRPIPERFAPKQTCSEIAHKMAEEWEAKKSSLQPEAQAIIDKLMKIIVMQNDMVPMQSVINNI